MIKQGNKSIIARMIGNKVIKATYKGALLVYQSIRKYLVKGVFPLTLLNTKGSKLIDYKMEGNSEQRILPREYQQVEYIESTGTQYIDAGFKANQNTGFDITFLTKSKLNNITGEFGSIMGARESSTVNEYQLSTFTNSTDKGLLRFESATRDADISENKKIRATLLNKVYTSPNGVQYILNLTFSTPVNLTIFALNNNESIVQHGKTQLYSLKLYDGDKLIRDYIPCYRISDNAIGLYDLVESKFYTNSGTGVFLKGSNVQGGTPTPDNPIEIVSVGEKTKNLFNLKSLVDNSILIYNGNETYTFTKTNVDRYTKLVNLVIPANTKFTATAEIIEYTGTSLYPLGVQFQMEDNTFEGFTFSDTTKKYTTSFNRPTKAVRLFLQYGDEVGAYTKFKNLQIEFGSKATAYEPYGYKIPVVSRGKNLLNKSLEPTSTTIYTACEELETGVKISNQTTGKGWRYSRFYIADANDFKNKTVYFNANVKLVNTPIVNVAMGYCDKDNTNGKVVSYMSIRENGNYKLSMDINSEVYKDKLLVVWLYSIASDTEEATELPSYAEYNELIISTEDTGYEPYKEPITTNIYLDEPLRKIGNYADYIDFGNKKLVRNVTEYKFKGTEILNNLYDTNTSGKYRMFLTIPNSMTGNSSSNKSIASNLYPGGTADSTYLCKLSIGLHSGGGAVIYDENLQTVEDMKAFITEQYNNGTPLIAIYPLANPTEQTIDLPSIPTLEGTTILDSTQNPSYVEVEYTNEEPKTSVPLTLADGNTLLDSNGDYFNVKEV